MFPSQVTEYLHSWDTKEKTYITKAQQVFATIVFEESASPTAY